MTLSGYPYDQSAGIGSGQGYDPTGLGGSVDAAFIAPQLSGKNPAEDVTRMQSELTKYATYAPAGMKPTRARVKHDKGGSTITIGFGYWDSKDQIEKGGENAAVHARGWRGTSVAVVDGTNALTVANATWNAMKDETGAYAAGASLLPGGKARAIKQYDFNPDQRRISAEYYVVNGNTTQGSSRTKIVDDEVMVLVKSVTIYDGTRWKVRLSAMRCINRTFTLRVNTAGTTLPEYTDKIGLVNSDTFLGLPAGTCMYNGVSYQSAWSDADKENKETLGYVFSACSLGFATVEEDDWILTSTDPGTVGDKGALKTASSFCANVEIPDSTTFSEFLSV